MGALIFHRGVLELSPGVPQHWRLLFPVRGAMSMGGAASVDGAAGAALFLMPQAMTPETPH